MINDTIQAKAVVYVAANAVHFHEFVSWKKTPMAATHGI
jgi:hypothetical protein